MALVDLMGMSASPDKSVEGLEKAKDAAILRQDVRQVTSQVATRLRVERTIPIKATLLSMRDTLETNEFIEDVL